MSATPSATITLAIKAMLSPAPVTGSALTEGGGCDDVDEPVELDATVVVVELPAGAVVPGPVVLVVSGTVVVEVSGTVVDVVEVVVELVEVVVELVVVAAWQPSGRLTVAAVDAGAAFDQSTDTVSVADASSKLWCVVRVNASSSSCSPFGL